jgi:hypothetical protein
MYYMFIPAIVITLGALVLAWQGWRYRKEQKSIATGLSREAKKLIEKMRTTSADLVTTSEKPEFSALGAPKYLATLCTVLVQKAGGSVRLTEKDFLNLPEEDYISIYVDVTDASILLCLNSSASQTTPTNNHDDDPTYN